MARLTLTHLIYEQWRSIPPVATADLAGRTVMVIGANTGIGFEASKHFARMNPGRLILACRDPAKGEAAVEKIKREIGYDPVELWHIDLSRFSSVVEFVDKFEKDGGRLDLLIQNAAVAKFSYEGTQDGWESTIQVNCLSLPLLALLLLPRMQETGREHGTTPRIALVASEVHFWSKIEESVLESGKILKTLGSKEYCTSAIMAGRYNDSKLLNVLFTRALSDRLSRSPASTIVNCLNPGYCYSELRRNYEGMQALIDWFMERFLAHTPEEGSRQLVWAAVGGPDKEDELRGAYISRSEVTEVSDFILSQEGKIAQDNVWDELIEILIRVDPRVKITVDKYLTSKHT